MTNPLFYKSYYYYMMHRLNAGKKYLMQTCFEDYYKSYQEYNGIAQFEAACEERAFMSTLLFAKK